MRMSGLRALCYLVARAFTPFALSIAAAFSTSHKLAVETAIREPRSNSARARASWGGGDRCRA